jgi:hypothetical protein
MKRLEILPILLLGAGLVVLGLLALNHIANTMWPFDVSRIELVRATAQQRVDASMLLAAANNEIILAFLASVVVAVTGLAMPVAYFLNKRFDPQFRDGGSPTMMTVTRQSLLAGLWVAFCFWLQMNRTLGIAVAALVAGVFILFEILLQIRARAAAMQQQHLPQ